MKAKNFLLLFVLLPVPSVQAGEELTPTEPALGTGMVHENCRLQFPDDHESQKICEVTVRVNLGISINGRMTAHEEVIYSLELRILALEAEVASLKAMKK